MYARVCLSFTGLLLENTTRRQLDLINPAYNNCDPFSFAARPRVQITNMNEGDLAGDIYFDARAYALPVRCADPLQRKSPTCTNPEVSHWRRWQSLLLIVRKEGLHRLQPEVWQQDQAHTHTFTLSHYQTIKLSHTH